MKIFAGSAHPQLAKKVCRELKTDLGKIEISRFPNGEKRIRILEKVKNEIVFIIQPTITDEDIVEFCLMVDAAGRLGAKKIVAIVPWFGYGAQDDVFRSGEPLSAKVIAQILETSGVDEVMIVDPHAKKIESFFTIPVTLLSALQSFSSVLKKQSLKDFLAVALDLGAMERSLRLAETLNLPLVLLQKTPRDRATGEIEFLGIKGKVKNKKVLLFDDFVSTGQTLIKAAKFLKKEGAKEIVACVSHYLSVKGLAKKLEQSLIDKIFVTNTLPISSQRKFRKLKIVSIAPLLAKTMEKMLR